MWSIFENRWKIHQNSIGIRRDKLRISFYIIERTDKHWRVYYFYYFLLIFLLQVVLQTHFLPVLPVHQLLSQTVPQAVDGEGYFKVDLGIESDFAFDLVDGFEGEVV